MYSINKSEGLPRLATVFSAAANVTGNPSYRARVTHHKCTVPINNIHRMNKCTDCEMSKMYIKRVLISVPSFSLPKKKKKYWKWHTPVNSITRSATTGPSSVLQLTNQFQHVNHFHHVIPVSPPKHCFMRHTTEVFLSKTERKHQRQLPAQKVTFKIKKIFFFF